MYELYYAPGAASFVVHWMLLEVGAPFELVRLDFEKRDQKSADYLKLNPVGVVPTLVIDGKPHSEAAALVMLLAERHPEAGLAPPPGDEQRADYFQWLFYLSNTLQPAFRLWFYPEEAAGAAYTEAGQDAARQRIESAWERIDAHLGDGRRFMLGDRRSAVDLYVTMLARWSRLMPNPAQNWSEIQPYLAMMKASPALIEAHRSEGLTDWIND